MFNIKPLTWIILLVCSALSWAGIISVVRYVLLHLNLI